jgi:hypothetical protein
MDILKPKSGTGECVGKKEDVLCTVNEDIEGSCDGKGNCIPFWRFASDLCWSQQSALHGPKGQKHPTPSSQIRGQKCNYYKDMNGVPCVAKRLGFQPGHHIVCLLKKLFNLIKVK